MESDLSIWTKLYKRHSLVSIKQLLIILFLSIIIILQQVKIIYMDIPYQCGIHSDEKDCYATMKEDLTERRLWANSSNVHQFSNNLQDSKMTNGYLINCTTVQEIKIGKLLGKGSRKSVYSGKFQGTKVAVKTMSFDSQNQRECLKKTNNKFVNCRNFPYLMALNEIVLHTQLKHPGLIKLLGYCIRDVLNPPLPDQPVHKQNIVSVFEYGTRFSPTMKITLKQRLQFAVDLCDILDYMEHSPLGSLYMRDLNSANIRLHDAHPKLSDIDRITAREPQCSTSLDCKFAVTCNNGTCVGQNAKAMMAKLTTSIFRHLLSHKQVPDNIASELDSLRTDNNMTASQVRDKLINLMTLL